MTIDELAAWAHGLIRANRTAYVNAELVKVCEAIVTTLDHAPSLPCGHTVAGARDTDGPYVELDGDTMSPEDARGLAVAILRAADAADSARAADEGEG
jgi:hypothetical protein